MAPAAPITKVLTPSVLYSTGRDLCLRGQALWWFTTDGNMAPRLWHVGEFDMTGDYDPASWTYRATIEGPTKRLVRTLTADEVVHIRIGEDAAAPWRGVSPLAAAADTAGALAGVESGLRKEANQVSGYVLPGAGVEGLDDASVCRAEKRPGEAGRRDAHRADPESATRRPLGAARRRRLGQARRLGIHPTGSAGRSAQRRGPGRARERGNTAGVGQPAVRTLPDLREGLRQLFHVTLQPIAKIVEAELARVLEVDVALDLSALAAADVQGRARAFRALVGGNNQNGIEVAEARRPGGSWNSRHSVTCRRQICSRISASAWWPRGER